MKIILATLGIISLILGIIGIFIPLLPTVPFVLLSAYLFARSSSRLHYWIMNHKVYGEYIRSYNQDKSIPMQVKVVAIGMLWLSMSISIFFVLKERWILQLLLGSITIGVTIFLLNMKTKKV
jgi:uncharacterized membrane protein YbaN (DUF454 family)